jgi:DNA-binding beta-propeller fold protein YncE
MEPGIRRRGSQSRPDALQPEAAGKPRTWRLGGALSVLAALALGPAAEGCGCSGSQSGASTVASTTTGAGATSSSTGGVGGTGGGGLNPTTVVTDLPAGWDATPDPTGVELYYTCAGAACTPGVYHARLDGTGTPAALATGLPFVYPSGIATDEAGTKLYIADSSADSLAGALDGAGVILALPVGGGSPQRVPGTAGYAPRSLDVAHVTGKTEKIYFTGTHAGLRGVFMIDPAGAAAPTLLTSGFSVGDPTGIAVARNGDIYVADTVVTANGGSTGTILRIAGDTSIAAEFVGWLFVERPVAYPTGLALSKDEKTLLVYGQDPSRTRGLLTRITLGDEPSILATTIDDAAEPAGLHRARSGDVYAGVDTRGATGGKVFVVQ